MDILEKKNKGEKPRFNDLYELLPEEFLQELSAIAHTETDGTKLFDQTVYFNDCVKTLNIYSLDKKINALSIMFNEETDIEKRKALAGQINKLMNEKKQTKTL